jgi:hypothetical protein
MYRRKNDGIDCVAFMAILEMPKALSKTDAAITLRRRLFHKQMSVLWMPLLAVTDRFVRELFVIVVNALRTHCEPLCRPISVTTAEGVTRNTVFPLGHGVTDWPENNLVHCTKDGRTPCPCNLCLGSVCVSIPL